MTDLDIIMNIEAAKIVDSMQAAPTTEAPTNTQETPKPPPQEEDRTSSKMQMLIQREQQALARERSAKEQESKLEEFLKWKKEFDEAKSGNSKKALELLGMDYNQLSESILKDGAIPPEVEINKVRSEFNDYKSEQEKKEQERVAYSKREAEEQEKRAVTNFKTEITQYLSDNKARYELTGFEEQQELVFDVIDEHYKRTINADTGVGKVMSIQEAADKVEEYLEKKEIERKKLSKVQTLWNAVPKVFQEKALKQVERQVTKPSTLTNQLSASPERPRTRPITDEERVQRAIAYANNLKGR